MFVSVYNQELEFWIDLTPHPYHKDLTGYDKISGTEIQTELTGIADDIQRTSVCEDPLQLEEIVQHQDNMLDDRLDTVNLAQNIEKGEILPVFLKKRSRMYSLATFHNMLNINGKTKKCVRLVPSD